MKAGDILRPILSNKQIRPTRGTEFINRRASCFQFANTDSENRAISFFEEFHITEFFVARIPSLSDLVRKRSRQASEIDSAREMIGLATATLGASCFRASAPLVHQDIVVNHRCSCSDRFVDLKSRRENNHHFRLSSG